MKTLPLVDRNMFSYSFIPALPLSSEEIIYLKTQRPLWNFPVCSVYRETGCLEEILTQVKLRLLLGLVPDGVGTPLQGHHAGPHQL